MLIETGNRQAEKNINQVFFVITKECNFRCGHCVFGCAPGTGETQDISGICDWMVRAQEAGFRMVDFSGGEPFLVERFEDLLYQVLENTTLDVSVASNLSQIHRIDWHRLAVHSKRMTWRLALEGSDREPHDIMRGTGAFDILVAGLKTLRSHGMKNLVANTIVSRVSQSSLPKIAALASDMGFVRHNWISLLPFGRAKNLYSWKTEPASWFDWMLQASHEIRGKTGLDVRVSGPILEEHENREEWPNEKIYNGYRSRAIVVMEDRRVFCDCFRDAFVIDHPVAAEFTVDPKELQRLAQRRYDSFPCLRCRFRFACRGLS